jgi:hypothetical protein
MARRPGGRYRIDFPIFAIAVVLSSLFLFYAGGVIERERCRDAGGRLLVFGADHSCDVGGGVSVPIQVLPESAGGRALVLTGWGMVVVALYGGMLRFVRGGRHPSVGGI